MKFSPALLGPLGLASLATAIPAASQPLVRAANDLEACRQAINCEVVEATNTSLARIRHTSDMGPGSAFLNGIMKRADDGTVETQVTLADAKVGYGCAADDLDSHPDPHAMLGNIDRICKTTGSCIQGEKYEETITVVDCSVGVCVLDDVKWVIEAEGEYPWGESLFRHFSGWTCRLTFAMQSLEMLSLRD